MEAELTPVTTMTQSWDGTIRTDSNSALTVDFDHFYKFWTNAKGNFTDPKGFCDLETVRPIWQYPAARKSVDCVGECVVVIRHLLIVTQPPSAPFFCVPSFTISAADPVCCGVPVRLPACPPAHPPARPPARHIRGYVGEWSHPKGCCGRRHWQYRHGRSWRAH